jgi:predicted GTPase
MKTNDNPFICALSDFDADFKIVSNQETDLLQRKSKLRTDIEKLLILNQDAINKDNILVKLSNELKQSIENAFEDWDTKLNESLPMKALSDQFADRIIFLVFGKVNAGKSAFCNFFAELFPNYSIKRFSFEKGKVKYSKKKRFAEGITETTASIQGLELGKRLILLDSPGLHSVTDKNGNLTRTYTDSADAILWLSPSSSPGQVQELNDLKDELEKRKPLQPIITRSDYREEEYREEKDDFISTLKNKSSEVRKLQEDDVIKRVKELQLDLPVKNPVSISVHYYNKNKSDKALRESGFWNLFEGLVPLIEEAKVYKVKKAKQQMINFLEKNILASLNKDIKPQIDKLLLEVDSTLSSLETRKSSLASMITADVVSEIYNIVNRHKASADKQAIARDLNNYIEKKINTSLQEELANLVSNLQKTSISLSSNELGDFKDVTIDVKHVKGYSEKAAATGFGGTFGVAVGAWAGSILGPLGTVAGGFIGGFFGSAAGSAAGDYFIETETITEKVGVSSEQVIQQTTAKVKELLPTTIDDIFKDVIKNIEPISSLGHKLSQIIEEFSQDVQKLKKG